MEEEANSWIRRTKFSHTVCHRLDSARLGTLALPIQQERNSGLKTRPGASSSNLQNQKNHVFSQIQRNPVTNKQRSLSPVIQSILSDTFKEARSDRKRFSTPIPKRRESNKGIKGKWSFKDTADNKSSRSSSPSNISPLRHLGTMKIQERVRSRKDSAWTKYFDHGGGRVNAVEAADDHTVDLSKLFLGLRFAHGAHSRLYHGIYNDEAVAVKLIRVPDDDESGTLAVRLEKQFNREVTLLSRLHHRNVIKVLNFPFLYYFFL